MLINLVTIHVIEAEEDLGVDNFHLTQTSKHLFDAIHSREVSHCGPSSLELILDLTKRIYVVLNDETGAEPCTILILQMSETCRLIRVVWVVVDECLALAEISRLTLRINLGDHLDQVLQDVVNFFLCRTLSLRVHRIHHGVYVHLDTEQV